MKKYIDITNKIREDHEEFTSEEKSLKELMEDGRTYRKVHGRVRQVMERKVKWEKKNLWNL